MCAMVFRKLGPFTQARGCSILNELIPYEHSLTHTEVEVSCIEVLGAYLFAAHTLENLSLRFPILLNLP